VPGSAWRQPGSGSSRASTLSGAWGGRCGTSWGPTSRRNHGLDAADLRQGTKVAVEIALMAADAGLVRTDEDTISMAGPVRVLTRPLLSVRPTVIIFSI